MAAFCVTVQVLTTQRSACSDGSAGLQPLPDSRAAIVSDSAWLTLHPRVTILNVFTAASQ